MSGAATDDYVTSSCIGRRVRYGAELGNQLFQLAAVLGYAERHGVRAVFHPWRCAFSGRDYGRLFPALEYREHLRPEHIFEQLSFRHKSIPHRPRCDLRGQFQSEKFFPKDWKLLREILAAPSAVRARVDETVRAHGLGAFSALHLRYYDRPGLDDGNFVMHTLPEHYHLAALDRLGRDLPVVLVTNNPLRATLFARRHLTGVRHLVLSDSDPLVDLYMLARADRLAIGNSTFGWWAGWLNETAPTVFAPDRRKWFSFLARADPYWDTSDLYGARFSELSY